MSTSQTTTTPVQQVTPELRRWIIAQAETGCLPEDVVKAMVASGWHEEVALDAMEQTLRSHLASLREAVPVGGSSVPEPQIGDGANAIVVDGHPVKVVMSLRLPRVVIFADLLTAQECDGLMAQATPRLVRSETVDTATGGSEVHAARTSDGMFFERGETPLIDRIERRIATLLNWPLDRGEGLQILRYRPGAQYKPHNDYFDPEQPGTPKIVERGGQRVGTLVMYLNTPQQGGATVFPDAGLEVAPVRGSAVFFSYDRPHAITKTLHGGVPVLAGEKWVATKWMRQGVFV
jgi:prolyl 4-hydroxylase